MKKISVLAMTALALASCGDNSSIHINVDSTGKKFDTTAEKLWDSTKAGVKRVGEKVKDKLDDVEIRIGRKDSTKN